MAQENINNGLAPNIGIVDNGLEGSIKINDNFTELYGYVSSLTDAVALNTVKVSNVDHPLVETAVPAGAVFTDTNTTYVSSDFDHNALTNYVADQHRIINDAGTLITDLFSASEIISRLSGKSDSGHDHDLVYEPIFTKGTAFNKDFGTLVSTVCQGNDSRLSDARTPTAHTHAGVYEPVLGFTAEDTANKGVINGYAELDGTGKIPSAQLPAFVDDVLEYANLAAFPGTGASGVIYIAIDTLKTYRWSGSAYAEISASLALGELSTTAYRGDRGKTAYDHSQVAHAPANADNTATNETSHTDVLIDSEFATAGLMKTDGIGGYSIDSNSYSLAGHAHAALYEPINANIQSHIASTANPHSVTAAQVAALALAGGTMTGGITVANMAAGINAGAYPLQSRSSIADSLTAVAHTFDTENVLATKAWGGTASIAAFKNAGVTKVLIDKNGYFTPPGFGGSVGFADPFLSNYEFLFSPFIGQINSTSGVMTWALSGVNKLQLQGAVFGPSSNAMDLGAIAASSNWRHLFMSGNIRIGGSVVTNVTTVTTSPHAAANEYFIHVNDTIAGEIVIVNLPVAANSKGVIYYIKKIGNSFNVTIDANASETIDGALTKVLIAQYESIMLVCDGTSWSIH